MYKTLTVAALFLAVLAFTSSSKSADATPGIPTLPLIVAKSKLVNLNAPISTTTIFTPTQDGLYRLSLYSAVTQADTASNVFWDVQIGWTDGFGQNNVLRGFYFTENGDAQGGPFFWNAEGFSGTSVVLQAKAKTPVTYAVAQTGALGNGEYSLYYTLERLE